MENAVDALKLAVSIFVFLLGLAILFNLTSQAQETARILITESDKTTYYTYYDSNEDTVDENGNRIVSLEDIIPTLYRYSEENYGVTIINKDKEIIARFDLDTETACNNWLNMQNSSKITFVEYLNKNILQPVDAREININTSNGMIEIFEQLYGQEANSNSTIRRNYYCAWSGYPSYTAQRIDSDLSGIPVTFSLTEQGTQTTIQSDTFGNHIPCVNGGIIAKYKNSKFTEYLIEVDPNSYITNENESLFSFGTIMETVKKEIIYVER